MFYNDTPKAYEFSDTWHTKWLSAFKLNSRFRDQPALNSALNDVNPEFELLNDRYNEQFVTSVKSAKNAAIWHYYASATDIPLTNYEVLLNKYIKTQIIKTLEIKKLMQKIFPWRNEIILDQIIINRIYKNGYMDENSKKYLQGYRMEAILGGWIQELRRQMNLGIRTKKIISYFKSL